MARRKTEHASVVDRGAGGAGPNVMRVIVLITCVTSVVAVIRGSRERTTAAGNLGTAPSGPMSSGPSSAPAASPGVPVPDSAGTSTAPALSDAETSGESPPVPAVPRIGIVAGHWGHDDGAACSDGLTEVQVNLQVAELVVQSLRGLGYRVDLLQEFDDRLTGYMADALVSIHADSCERFPDATPPPTGFKVASVVDSYVPEEEELLVDCLSRAYAERTGLPVHENSITGHMTGYHTFYAIDGRTPGAIIETGFMWLDRDLLTQHPDVVAQGIVDGIVCFVEGE